MNLAPLWKELEADWRSISGYCSRRLPDRAPCPVYVGVEKPSNSRSLLVVGPVVPGFRLPESRGLAVRTIEPTIGSPGSVTLAVVLRDATFSEVFDSIVEDITERLTHCHSEEAAMETVVSRVRLWQLFLEKQGEPGLGRDGQLGLYGELWFLRHVLLSALRPATAVRAWTGPTGTNQDFQLGVIAFEIKATAAKQHQRLAIASERQLDSTGLDSLVLVHLSFDVRQGAGETLPSAIADLIKRLRADSTALADLSDRLLAAGYSHELAESYGGVGYTEREHHFMLVSGDFPRITESDLRRGIGDVRYSISVAECLHHVIPEGAVAELLTKVAHGH